MSFAILISSQSTSLTFEMRGDRFFNGGILFSTVVLCFIALISLYSFLLLVKTRLVVHGSFGGMSPPLRGRRRNADPDPPSP